MPQLDILTFFSQFFWLCFFYIGFYYIIYKYFLPQYSRCILFRDKLTHSSFTGSRTYIEEKENIEKSLYMFTNSAVGFSKNIFGESRNNTHTWYKFCYKKTNEEVWKAPNLLYIQTFGAKQASKNLCKNCISYIVGSSLYTKGLFKSCLFFSENTPFYANSFGQHVTRKYGGSAPLSTPAPQKNENYIEPTSVKPSKKSTKNYTTPKTLTQKKGTVKKT